MHASNKDVQELAAIIERSPSAVARKLGNFASFDPKLQARGVKGLENVSKLDREVWQEYMNNWDELFIESETLLAQMKNTTIEALNPFEFAEPEDTTGREAIRQVVVRLDQTAFRKMVLSNFNYTCCITGIDKPELLIASHISKWSEDAGNRLNPRNGLALNSLHDNAFERGFITITEDLKIRVSSILLNRTVAIIKENFTAFNVKDLIPPKKFSPDPIFLKMHNDRFKP